MSMICEWEYDVITNFICRNISFYTHNTHMGLGLAERYRSFYALAFPPFLFGLFHAKVQLFIFKTFQLILGSHGSIRILFIYDYMYSWIQSHIRTHSRTMKVCCLVRCPDRNAFKPHNNRVFKSDFAKKRQYFVCFYRFDVIHSSAS